MKNINIEKVEVAAIQLSEKDILVVICEDYQSKESSDNIERYLRDHGITNRILVLDKGLSIAVLKGINTK